MTTRDTTAGRGSRPIVDAIEPARLGTAELVSAQRVEAGSWQTHVLVYRAGHYGIDDSGSLRICFRFAADGTRPQFSDPAAPGYTTVRASNGATLECRYDPKGNIRPFDQTVYIKIVKGFLKEGDTITVTLGDSADGSPGIRVQTFAEESFEFHVLVDPIATFNYQPLPVQPCMTVVPGKPVRHLLVLPTLRRCGEGFRLGIKGEDLWGNPCDLGSRRFYLRPSMAIENLPDHVDWRGGETGRQIDGLTAARPGELVIRLVDRTGAVLASSNPMVVTRTAEYLPFWADLHGQSEETIGTNSAEDYFRFARDSAFVDVAGHQGNDFQITDGFWRQLNTITARFDQPGRFVTLPGYEWSGNTSLGGDRNVYYRREGRPIYRSSTALVPGDTAPGTVVSSAAELFSALADNDEDAVCFAHCGGRYADIGRAHDGRFERSVEIHSSWGTFDWLLRDAFRLGHRVGIVANSDGHKGRPGASYPGASKFGAIGGLTCLLLDELTRDAVFDALRSRRHYATSGGANGRLHVDVTAEIAGMRCSDDPAIAAAIDRRPVTRAMMGDIVETGQSALTLGIDVVAASGIERIEIFNGPDLAATVCGYDRDEPLERIRVVWEGASDRGRSRQVIWDGGVELEGAGIERFQAINFFNPERVLTRKNDSALVWSSVTTGNFAGFDIWCAPSDSGLLRLATPIIECAVRLEDIGFDPRVWQVDGELPRLVRMYRLPAADLPSRQTVSRRIGLEPARDNPIYVRVTLEDGTLAWTSPIYALRG